MKRSALHGVVGGLLVAGVIGWLPGKVGVWVDGKGQAVLSNSESPPTPDAREVDPADLATRWRGQWQDVPLETPSADPTDMTLAAAIDDLKRGDRRRGLRSLRDLQRAHPERADVAWMLAQVELARGRPEAALEALDAALSLAVEMPDGWRDRAQELRTSIQDEIAHASALSKGEPLRVQESAHFRLRYDHPFAGRGDGDRVLQALEAIRERLAQHLDRTLAKPLEVRLYTRATYLRDYGHRFGFATVGFFDGAIHVVASRRPEPRLTALLTHEYTHALFLAALAGHEPFFMNEGLAQLEEERARGQTEIGASEWRTLLDAMRSDTWLPLRSLVRGFAGLEADEARLAYLESRAAADFVERRAAGSIGRWLTRCSKGEKWEAALRAEIGMSVEELDAALRADVQARFPSVPGAYDLVPGAPRRPTHPNLPRRIELDTAPRRSERGV
jgi:hypothetical protein